MNAPERLQNAFSGKEKACETCGGLFEPKRAWSAYCGDKCRSAFNASQARVKAVRDAGPRLFEALRRIAQQDDAAGAIAQEAIAGLKALDSPKAILEKRAA